MSHYHFAKRQLGNSAYCIHIRSSKKTSEDLQGVSPIPVPHPGEYLFTHRWHNVEKHKKEEGKFFVISIEQKKILRCLPTMDDCVEFINTLCEQSA